MPTRRVLLAGLITMGVVALATAFWPAVAGVVATVLALVVAVAVSVPLALVVRWVRGELTERRELRAMPPVTAIASEAAPAAPTLAWLRESA